MKIKAFFFRFSNEYSETFQKFRLISQIPLFAIALINFMEILRIIQTIPQTENVSWEVVKEASILPILISVIFFSRFLLLFSAAKTSFWFSQILWLFSLLTLYYFVDFNQRPCWVRILPDISIIYSLYIFGSLLHQSIILLFSLNKVSAK